MGTLSIQVTETGQTNLTKTYTIADSDIDKIVAAYTILASNALNASGLSTFIPTVSVPVYIPITATRAQALQYMLNTWVSAVQSVVQQSNIVPAVVPSLIGIS